MCIQKLPNRGVTPAHPAGKETPCVSASVRSPWLFGSGCRSPRAPIGPLFRGNALQNGVAQSPLPDKLDIRWKIHVKDGIRG